jgi:hypothetical protein
MAKALKIDLEPAHRLAVCRPVQIFGAEHTGQLLNFLLALEETNPEPFNRLLDLTFVTDLQLSGPVIFEYARTRRQTTARRPRFRTAIIAPDTGAEEVALIYATLMECSKIQVGIFPDASSAAKWLHVPEAVTQLEAAKQE